MNKYTQSFSGYYIYDYGRITRDYTEQKMHSGGTAQITAITMSAVFVGIMLEEESKQVRRQAAKNCKNSAKHC